MLDLSVYFDIDYGSEGVGTASYSLELSSSSIGSGIYALDTSDQSASDGDGYGQGQEILLTQDPNGDIIGSADGVDYFKFELNSASGEVTFTQLNNVYHDNTSRADEAVRINTLDPSDFALKLTVSDAAGNQVSDTVDLGNNRFSIEDDAPNTSLVNYVERSIDGSGNTVYRFYDYNGDVINPLSTDEPELSSIEVTGGGAGVINFDSSQNGPVIDYGGVSVTGISGGSFSKKVDDIGHLQVSIDGQTVATSEITIAPDNMSAVIQGVGEIYYDGNGKKAKFYLNPSNEYSGGTVQITLTETGNKPKSDTLTLTPEVKSSAQGLGVGNNVLSKNETMVFSDLASPVVSINMDYQASKDGSVWIQRIDENGNDVGAAFSVDVVKNTGSSTANTLSIDPNDGLSFSGFKVFDTSVGQANGLKIKFIDINYEDPTTITITDADGDISVINNADLRDVAYDDTLQWNAPVTIDLDRDGNVEYLSIEEGISFYDEYTGETIDTAWFGPSDGLLVIDSDGSGTINTLAEFVFTEWSEYATTDLLAIAEVFDSNADGLLSVADEMFEQFGIWQDSDSDGETDEGEFQSLLDFGISEIALTYGNESTSRVEGYGDVQVLGSSNALDNDGLEYLIEDTMFEYKPHRAEPATYETSNIDVQLTPNLEKVELFSISTDTASVSILSQFLESVDIEYSFKEDGTVSFEFEDRTGRFFSTLEYDVGLKIYLNLSKTDSSEEVVEVNFVINENGVDLVENLPANIDMSNSTAQSQDHSLSLEEMGRELDYAEIIEQLEEEALAEIADIQDSDLDSVNTYG